jgi:hypothetical protein
VLNRLRCVHMCPTPVLRWKVCAYVCVRSRLQHRNVLNSTLQFGGVETGHKYLLAPHCVERWLGALWEGEVLGCVRGTLRGARSDHWGTGIEGQAGVDAGLENRQWR